MVQIWKGGERQRPENEKGSRKYDGWGGTGMYTWQTYERYEHLSREARYELVLSSNNSLSKSTWAGYRTALRHLQRCRKQTGWRLELPLEEEEVVHWVVWLRRKRNLQASSVENMLTAIKKVT